MAALQAYVVANIYRVEDLLHLAIGKQPTSSSATYELSPCRHHHHHQAATIIYLYPLRRSGHPLSHVIGCPSVPILIILPFLERRCPQRRRVFSSTWCQISNITTLHLQVFLASHTISSLIRDVDRNIRPTHPGIFGLSRSDSLAPDRPVPFGFVAILRIGRFGSVQSTRSGQVALALI
jgi:hypothetical protein